MIAWAALLRKDFRLTRTVFFVGLVINLLILLFSWYLDENTGDNLFMFIPLLAAIVFHILYLPIMLFMSLRTESDQLHLWLQNPHSAAALLLSKMLNGLIMSVISLAALYLTAGLFIHSRFRLFEAYWADTWKAGLLSFPHIMLISIMLGVWLILLWSMYHALKYRIGRWTWLALLAAVLIPYWLAALINASSLYKRLTQWGGMQLKFPTFSINPIPVYAGGYLCQFIVIIGLFYLSAWIIDRKVEV